MEIIRISQNQINLVIELFNQYRIFYKQPSDLKLAESFIRARLSSNESVIFVAMAASKPVAFTQLYPKYSSMRVSKNWILNDLYVEENYRKQGIGRQLIQQAMDFARTEGANFVELSTAVDNETAQSLYQHIGFKKQEPETDFYTYRIGLKDQQ